MRRDSTVSGPAFLAELGHRSWPLHVALTAYLAGMVGAPALSGPIEEPSGAVLGSGLLESDFDTDFNGDGDLQDGVLYLHSLGEGTTRAIAAGRTIEGDALSGSLAVVYEQNSETSAGRFGYYDLDTDSFTVLTPYNPSRSAGTSVDGDMIAWSSGDSAVRFIYYHDIATGLTTDTGIVGERPSLHGDVIAFQTREDRLGADLDGDGSITTRSILRYHDITSGRTFNLGIGTSPPSLHSGIIAFSVSGPLGAFNLLQYYDIEAAELVDTGLIGGCPGGCWT